MEIKKSLTEYALKTKKALLIGIGGGGDIIQCIPIHNYLRLLGVEEIFMGGVSCEWWPFDTEGKYAYSVAPTVYEVEELNEAEIVAPQIARVNEDTNYRGRGIAEGKVAGVFGQDTYVLSVKNGVKNLARGINQFIKDEGIDLVVGMDAGSDSMYSGERELTQPRTPLVDFITLASLTQLNVPVVYGLAGYGCDGEVEDVDLENNVSIIMKNNGFLGAYGLTQQDVADMDKACAEFPDPVEGWPAVAARGEFGPQNMKLMDVWGVTVNLRPLTAVSLFFDPQVVVGEVARYAGEMVDTTSLTECEEILLSHEVIPETRLPQSINYLAQE